jgi:ethanolamine ammonia-lyase large subunit
MLNYQSTSFHDALVMRQILGVRPSPEFEEWLFKMRILQPGSTRLTQAVAPGMQAAMLSLTGAL